MKTIYCERCGKKLIKVGNEIAKTRYDRETGERIDTVFVILQCPDYVSGYSDNFYEYHDRIEAQKDQP